jgi:hypothetical protein
MALQTTILRGNISNSFVMGVTFTSTTVATSGASKTVTVPGLKVGDAVTVTLPAAQTTGVGVANAYVSAENTLIVQFINATGSSATAAAGTYTVVVDRPEYLPLDSNAV